MKKLWLIPLLALTACVHDADYQAYLTKKSLQPPTIEKFQHCRGYGCQYKTDIEFTSADWKAIERAFKPKPKNAEQERQRIAKVIGVMETKVGAMTGTHEDKAGTFDKTGHYQLDCVDESTNTTTYLAVLQEKKLLRFHTVAPPTVRTPFQTGRWPHQTAVITESKTNASYVVDSWFHDNGAPAEIVPLEQWKDGWKPG